VKSLQDLVYLARWENSWNLGESVTSKLGFSGLYGPNATGLHGDTWIYGADLVVKWRPARNYQGWPFLLWESEIMNRVYRADSFFQAGDAGAGIPDISLPAKTLRDWGLYTQLLWGFRPRWAAGVRYEYASGSGNDVNVDLAGGLAEMVSRNTDPFRDNRHRISPLLVFHPSEFSRLRLQYNYDWAAHLPGRDAHTVWLGAEILYGAHPAHKY
jgi:outer membrane receptor protein involved in Fe transport